ncbi:Sua5/YciO/YrdC/YwlC family protein [Pseudaeromonas paramecii]|uniref:Threonylcarbamoyl-AMP synthase n=2 Tax=Pseudaeromonas paramecii TaxID=2138166 RepID=A0ABP8PZ63_9GAMM
MSGSKTTAAFLMTSSYLDAISHLTSGHVIAYATEAVFGLGCDPDNEEAVKKLLNIKQRPVDKGLILIAADWSQLLPYVASEQLSAPALQKVLASWPGPFTWIMPAQPTTPRWLTGRFDSLAVRVTAHPQVRALCQAYGKPLVSTSANLSGEAPCRNVAEVQAQLGVCVDYVLPGEVGGATNPSQIRNALTGEVLRPA